MLLALGSHRPSESHQPLGHTVRLCSRWELTQAPLPIFALVENSIKFTYSSPKYWLAASQ